MAGKGAPKGNNNAAKAKIWTAAIERALEKRLGDRIQALDDLAEKLLKKCDEGDLQALKELGDRLEGKPNQSISGDPENPLHVVTKVVREIVDAANKDS